MEFTAGLIAELISGEILGNPNAIVRAFAPIEKGEAGSLSFLENPKYEAHIYQTDSTIVLVNKDFRAERALPDSLTLIKVEHPRIALAKLLEAYMGAIPKPTGVSSLATVHETVNMGTDVYIAPGARVADGVVLADGVRLHENVVVGRNTRIGKDTEIMPNSTIYHDCVIGEGCVFHAGVVIGADGFGFAPNSESNYFKIPHIGNVVIEDHVEIGANSCIDRATMGSTRIGKGVKIDNLIQVGHNSEIGEFSVLAAQVGVAGTTVLGKRNMIGGQVGFAGHIHTADDVKIAAQSGIARSIKEEGAVVQGSPAFDKRAFNKSYVVFRNLPKMKRVLDTLEKDQD